MGNINVIAVASLAEVSCIIVADGAKADQDTIDRADKQGIPLFVSELPAFLCAKSVYDCINSLKS
jgi:predicted transcriptional regulator